MKFLLLNGLYQHVNEVTQSKSIIDCILCDKNEILHNVHCTENFSSSDHNCVSFDIRQHKHSTAPRKSIIRYNFRLADWLTINCMLASVNWNKIINNNHTIEEARQIFYYILQRSIWLHVPEATNSGLRDGHFRWYLCKFKQQKTRLWSCVKKNSLNTNARVRYKVAAKELKTAVNKWLANAEMRLLNSRKQQLYI